MSDNHQRNSAPRVISVANQKGGVGKTTTAINLGTALAAIKQRVVIIDWIRREMPRLDWGFRLLTDR